MKNHRPRSRHLAPGGRAGSWEAGRDGPVGYMHQPLRQLPLVSDPPEVVDLIATTTDYRDEPEGISEAIADEYGETARQYASLRHLQDIAAREQARELLSMERRLVDARHRAKMRHVDVSHELHIVERDLDRARRGGRREPERAVRRLERVEAVLDCKPDLAA